MSAIEEPEPGYTSTLTGAMGLIAGAGAGILKVIYISQDCSQDVTPQDLGIKSLCFYAMKSAKIYENNKQPPKLPVYQTSSYGHLNGKFVEYITISQENGVLEQAAFEKNLLLPHVYFTGNRFVYLFLVNIIYVNNFNILP